MGEPAPLPPPLHHPPEGIKDLNALVEVVEMRIFIVSCQKEQVPSDTYNSTGLVGTQVYNW